MMLLGLKTRSIKSYNFSDSCQGQAGYTIFHNKIYFTGKLKMFSCKMSILEPHFYRDCSLRLDYDLITLFELSIDSRHLERTVISNECISDTHRVFRKHHVRVSRLETYHAVGEVLVTSRMVMEWCAMYEFQYNWSLCFRNQLRMVNTAKESFPPMLCWRYLTSLGVWFFSNMAPVYIGLLMVDNIWIQASRSVGLGGEVHYCGQQGHHKTFLH